MGVLGHYVMAVRDDRGPIAAISANVLFPLVFGGIALLPSVGMANDTQILTAVALVAGLLFSMLVLLIDLRGRVRRGEEIRAVTGDRDTLNLDYAFYVASYTIVVGFLLAAYLLLQERASMILCGAWATASDWVAFFLTAHFGVAAFQALKRLQRCYEVFGRGSR